MESHGICMALFFYQKCFTVLRAILVVCQKGHNGWTKMVNSDW